MLPPPIPCLLLILRNNRGCSHLPKTPSLGKERGKAVSWLNKAETPACQKHTDVRQAQNHCGSVCPAHCAHTRVVWVGDQLGWETHSRGKDSSGPISQLLALLLLMFLSHWSPTQAPPHTAKNNAVLQRKPLVLELSSLTLTHPVFLTGGPRRTNGKKSNAC